MPRSVLKLLQYVSAILNSIFVVFFPKEKKLCKNHGFSLCSMTIVTNDSES